MNNRLYKQTLSAIFSMVLLLLYSAGYAENIDSVYKYAYGENVGWINFEPFGEGGPGVEVEDDKLTGYAWGENIGWINLSPSGSGVSNDGVGNLSGYAWSENVGWINFAPDESGVTIDPATGEFSGYAWGENIGWINFAPNGVGIKSSWRGDADSDGHKDDVDNCPSDYNPGQEDSDNDGVGDICDGCPGEPDTDTDGDETLDCNDGCPNDANKTEPGVCGCGEPDTDTDGDETLDCNDGCPNDVNKVEPGICGCGEPDTDTDGDEVLDCNDGCPNDVNKVEPGICGCGEPDTDTDEDQTPDCNDGCPNDPENDVDGDGVCGDVDGCPNDQNKTNPGACGCGAPDIDSDEDKTPDCIDGCPSDPNKIEKGLCGCGTPETDSDNDGAPDCIEDMGPNNGDSNNDEKPDRLQGNVASVPTSDGQDYITLVVPEPATLSDFTAVQNPDPDNTPHGVDFPYGLIEFTINGLANDSITAILYLPDGTKPTTYYKWGPTPGNQTPHWYNFMYNGQTGAEINGNVITLYLKDGYRGDDKLTIDNAVIDLGGPGFAADISFSPVSLDFGSLTVKDSSTLTITLMNEGPADLSITGIALSDTTNYSIAGSTAIIKPGDSHEVTVTFIPQSTGNLDATLDIESNDPNEPTVTVQLLGQGAAAGGGGDGGGGGGCFIRTTADNFRR